MKKKLILLSILILFIIISLNIYSAKKTKNINYAIKKYSTSGIFNKHKLCKLNKWKIEFSDGNMCIVKVEGIRQKSPHSFIDYKMLLEKNKNGLWKLKKYYPEPSVN